MRATSELAAQVGRRPDERPAGPTSLTGLNPANTFSHANSEAKRVHHAEIANEQFLLLKHAILSLHSTTWFGPRLLLQPVPADQFRKPIDLVSPCWRTDAHRLVRFSRRAENIPDQTGCCSPEGSNDARMKRMTTNLGLQCYPFEAMPPKKGPRLYQKDGLIVKAWPCLGSAVTLARREPLLVVNPFLSRGSR